MSSDKRARLREWLASGEARLQPLSVTQRELWEATPVPVGDSANHICCVIHVRGRLTPERSRDALQLVVERQEVLRLSILPGKDGPLQMIRRTGEPSLRFHELTAAESVPEAMEERAQALFREPFDLLQGPLYRAEAMQRGPDEHVLACAIHHAIGDGWSLGVLVQDLACAYAQALLGKQHEPLPPVPQTYTEWSAAERAYWQGGEIAQRADFWRTKLGGSRPLWPEQAAPPYLLHRTVLHLPVELSEAIRALARKLGATLYSTLLSAFQVALARWSGRNDLVVGTPVANRSKPNCRETMGSYAGIVPLRAQVDGERPFGQAVRHVHENAMDAFANALPFAELVKVLGEQPADGMHPIFDVRFALQNHPIPDVKLPTLSAQLRMRSTGTARFHLGCEVTEEGSAMEVVWLSRTGLFSVDEVRKLHELFQAVLTSGCHAPETRVAHLVP